MSGYLLGVIGTVLFSAVLTAIIPNGKTASIIKSVARLACLVAVLSPLLSFLKNGEMFGENFTKTGIQTDTNFIEYCSKISIENAENSLEEHLQKRYGKQFKLTLLWEEVKKEEGAYEVERIKITKAIVSPLSGTISKEERIDIEKYLMENFDCPSEVVINGDG